MNGRPCPWRSDNDHTWKLTPTTYLGMWGFILSFVVCINFSHSSAGLASAEEWVPPVTTLTQAPGILRSLTTEHPPAAKPVVQVLNEWLKALEAREELNFRLKHLRTERDEIKTELVAIDGERAIRAKHKNQLEQHLQTIQQQRDAQLEAIRKEFESRLEKELGLAKQQLTEEMAADFDRQLRAFEERQRALLLKGAEEDLDFEEREIQRVSLELEEQAQELISRLKELDVDKEAEASLKQSLQQAIMRRQSTVEVRRAQLDVERDALLASRRAEFAEKLKEQQVMNQQKRLILKEATLRQAMADLLHHTSTQEATRYDEVRQALEKAIQRHSELERQYADLGHRLQTIESALVETAHRTEEIDRTHSDSLVRLEEGFEKVPQGINNADVLAWFNRIIPQFPPMVAHELAVVQQRLLAKAEQDRLLEEQHRVQRERELARQLTQEMERRYDQIRQAAAQEQETKRQKVEGLLSKATQLASQGKFQEALKCVTQAQNISPPDPNRVALVREDILAAQQQTIQQATATQIQALFTQAMQAFQHEQYEEAISLFERVIEQEAKFNATVESISEGAS